MCSSALPSVRHRLPSPGSVKLLTSLVGTWHGPDFCGELEGDSKEKCGSWVQECCVQLHRLWTAQKYPALFWGLRGYNTT